MAELYVFGQLLSATGFSDHSLFCKWKIHSGNSWKLISGHISGQTQVDNPLTEERALWSHPIDIHFATTGLQGWPKFEFQVWHQDFYGRCNIWSYGFLHIPSRAGFHKLECHTWRPIGAIQDRITQLYTGECFKLTNDEIIINNEERYKLQTETMGKVNIELYVVLRHFDKYGIQTK